MTLKKLFKRRSKRPFISVLDMADGSKKYVVRYYQQTWAGNLWTSSDQFINIKDAEDELDKRLGQMVLSETRLT